jgi:hypothetical protein
MRRDELTELHYITPIENVRSILSLGILSHARAARVQHTSVAMQEIQDRRSKVTIPGGRRLHDYVNLYICGRNPMMYKRRDQAERLCVLSVSPDVLDLSGVVVTDGNASSKYARFAAAPQGLAIVDRAMCFAESWTDTDEIQGYRKRFAKCAEALVPDRVDPRYVLGLYVPSEQAVSTIAEACSRMVVQANPHLFFA